MTISSSTASASYTGNGTTTAFTIPFYFLVDTDVKISQKNGATGAITVLTLNSDYTLTGAGNQAGGSATLVAAPAGGTTPDQLFIERNVDAVQETAYPANSPFPAASHEKALDRLTMLVQQILSKLTFGLFRNPLAATYDLGGNTLSNVADAVNAQDVPSLVQTQTLVTGAATGIVPSLIATRTQLAASAGASLMGFIQSGTGAASRNLQSKGREVSISPEDFGAVGDGVTIDDTAFANAINELVARGGGVLDLQAKTYALATPIVVSASNILLRGKGSNVTHDGGTGSNAATTLAWSGASGATMLTFQTPSGTGNSKRRGGGVVNVVFDCKAVAGTAIYVHTWVEGQFRDVYALSPTQQAFKLSSYTAGTIGEASDTQRNIFERCTWRAIDSAAVQSAHGMVITSDAPGTANANSSYNTFIDCYGLTYNGDGWRMIDADNNHLYSCTASASGTGKAMRLQGAYGNTIIGWNGSVKIEGTASGAWANAVNNVFFSVDESNGTAYPTIDSGCSVQWHGHKYGWVNLSSQKGVFAQTQATAQSELANLGNDTLRIHNTSQSGIALTDGTHVYHISQDASGNLRITLDGASGTLDLTQGNGIFLKTAGVGFFSHAPVTTRPTVTGAKGSNAALGSLLTQLASLGLITDSTTT